MAKKEEFSRTNIYVLFTICVLLALARADKTYVSEHSIDQSAGHLSVRSGESESGHRVRRAVDDAKCKNQASTFLQDLGQTKIDKEFTFLNESKDKLAMAWAGQNDGTLIAVTSSAEWHGKTKESTVYRSEDFGASFKDISNLTNVTKTIKISDGVQRNPHDPKKMNLVGDGAWIYITTDRGKSFSYYNLPFVIDGKLVLALYRSKVYLVGDGPWIYITTDGGIKFSYYDLPFVMDGKLVFHNSKTNDGYMLAKSTEKTLFISKDNAVTWKKIHTGVDAVYWGIAPKSGREGMDNPDNDMTIYISAGANKIDPILQHFLNIEATYTLKKTTDGGLHWQDIHTNVVSFERRGKFLYASTAQETKTVTSIRRLQFSVDNGKTWREAKLPTIEPDQFYQVMEIEDNMVFMHVDNKDDTGHGTLYTSAGDGVIYSESLPRHLYPNYGTVHDFYKVHSMRGVYITSQMSGDASIHSVITYNRGAEWQKIPRPAGVPCKDETKECYLQIHGMYSLKRNLRVMPPMSEETAKGLILVHGHVADALQKTAPDVFVTSDGGYTWNLALKGPHMYQIGDSGGLIVAVSMDPNPTQIKFSLDEGRCWHNYTFTEKKLNITGLLTEPEGRSATFMIWGYVANTSKWEIHVIDFQKVVKNKCGDSDYEPWVEHVMHGSTEVIAEKGCMLGQRRTFMRLKKDSWCYNGYDHEQTANSEICPCTIDDYECDYGYFRPGGSQKCVKIPEFKGEYIEICLRGHEEKEISEGYRKIPGDVCNGGFAPQSRKIVLGEKCDDTGKTDVEFDEHGNPIELTGGRITKAAKVVAVIVVIVVLLLAVVMGAYFLHKFLLLRRNKTEYRYSLLNAGEDGPRPAGSTDDRENSLDDGALTANLAKYLDSDEEELSTKVLPPSRRPVNAQNGKVKQKDTNPFTSYHDDSDDDLLS